MCGLFGAFGNFENKHAAIAMLCIDNMSRGRDSTGISVDGKIYKDVVPANVFVKTQRFKDMIKDGKVIIGHTRLATHGSVTVRNAHPFLISGNLIGTHNGIVSNLSELRKIIGKDYEVDSQYLLELQYKKGNTNLAAGMLNMAYSFRKGENANKLFLQKHDNSLYVAKIRNPDNTVGWMYSSIHSGLDTAVETLGLDADIYCPENYSRIQISDEGLDYSTYEVERKSYFGSFGIGEDYCD